MRPSTLLASLWILGVVGVGLAYPAFAQDQRKDATAATKAANDRLLDVLPFSGRSDFESAKRGLIAPLRVEMIEGQAGNPIWNPEQYSFITEDAAAPDTVNPSLWRQSQLINIGGLFEVTDGIYQVRNQDLSNMTIIEGRRGNRRRRSAAHGGDGQGRDRPLFREPRPEADQGRELHPQPRRPFRRCWGRGRRGRRGFGRRQDLCPGRLPRGRGRRECHGGQRDEPPGELHVRQPAPARRQGAGRRRARHHNLGRHCHADPADRHHFRDRPQGGDRRPDL
jgi:hypothetical protein